MALDDKTKQDMESGLEHAVRIVQARFAQLEQNVFIPCMSSSRLFASEHPIIATFISIFLMLSLLPVLSFLGFSVLVSATFASIAFAIAFLVSIVLIIAAGGLLAITLGVLFIGSIFLTVGVVALFVTARLGQHLRTETNVKQGINHWIQETRGRLTWHPTTNSNIHETKASDRRGSDEWQAVNNAPS